MKSHELSLAAEKALRDNGGDILYDTEGKKLLVEDGRVVGVQTENWKITADQVICNMNPSLAFGRMMDPKDVSTNHSVSIHGH